MSKPTRQETVADTTVSGFEGYYNFLSNDYPVWVHFEGISYPSISTAFQAARTEDQSIREKIAVVTDAEEFRKIAMSIKNPPEWSGKKEKVMEKLVRDKFKRNKDILEKLMKTKDKNLINSMKSEGFNELFWGEFKGKGNNILGKILMRIRDEFTKCIDSKQWIENNLNLESDLNMFADVTLTVLKDSKQLSKLSLDKSKNYYLFGSLKTSDFHLEHPTISRFHACIFFSNDLEVMLVDLNSSQGTALKRKGQEKIVLEPLISYKLFKDDLIYFGLSTREYLVDINRGLVEKYVIEQEDRLREGIKDVPDQRDEDFEKLDKNYVKQLLGVQDKCLLVWGLSSTDNYTKLKEIFNKLEKVVNVRIKINSRTGRNEDQAVIYFESSSAVQRILENRNSLPYKVKQIREEEAEFILGGHKEKSRDRSKSQERSRNKR